MIFFTSCYPYAEIDFLAADLPKQPFWLTDAHAAIFMAPYLKLPRFNPCMRRSIGRFQGPWRSSCYESKPTFVCPLKYTWAHILRSKV